MEGRGSRSAVTKAWRTLWDFTDNGTRRNSVARLCVDMVVRFGHRKKIGQTWKLQYLVVYTSGDNEEVGGSKNH